VKAFLECFVRDGEGRWRCIQAATLHLPTGRVQVNPGSVFVKGQRFMNVDLAEYLDAEARKPQAERAQYFGLVL